MDAVKIIGLVIAFILLISSGMCVVPGIYMYLSGNTKGEGWGYMQLFMMIGTPFFVGSLFALGWWLKKMINKNEMEKSDRVTIGIFAMIILSGVLFFLLHMR